MSEAADIIRRSATAVRADACAWAIYSNNDETALVISIRGTKGEEIVFALTNLEMMRDFAAGLMTAADMIAAGHKGETH